MDMGKISKDITERIMEYDRNLDRWTHYETLYITKNATMDDVKSAYRKLVQLMHPDRYGHDLAVDFKEKLEYIFNEINRAYNILKQESERTKYDRSLFYAEDHGQPVKVSTERQVAQAQYKKGFVALQKKDLEPAIGFFRSAINLSPNDAEYHAKLALALSIHKNPRIQRTAINACREAIKLNHENANYHALMGKIYQRLNDFDEAEVHYRRALTWSPTHHLSQKELKNIKIAKSLDSPKGLKGKLSRFFSSKKSASKSKQTLRTRKNKSHPKS